MVNLSNIIIQEIQFLDIVFEGEYKEGKIWNGNIYDSEGDLEFELEEGTGEIKEYNYLGKLLFEGEYKYGKRWNGIMYNNNGDIEFKIKEGYGKGKEYNYLGKQIFEGVYKNGKREGIGKEFNNDILIFEGKYRNGKREGNGKEYNKYGNLIFDGEFSEGKKMEGNLREYFDDKFLFKADFSKKQYSRYYNISVSNYSLVKTFDQGD